MSPLIPDVSDAKQCGFGFRIVLEVVSEQRLVVLVEDKDQGG